MPRFKPRWNTFRSLHRMSFSSTPGPSRSRSGVFLLFSHETFCRPSAGAAVRACGRIPHHCAQPRISRSLSHYPPEFSALLGRAAPRGLPPGTIATRSAYSRLADRNALAHSTTRQIHVHLPFVFLRGLLEELAWSKQILVPLRKLRGGGL